MESLVEDYSVLSSTHKVADIAILNLTRENDKSGESQVLIKEAFTSEKGSGP